MKINYSLARQTCVLTAVVLLSACTVNKPIETSPPNAKPSSNEAKTNTKPSKSSTPVDELSIKYEPLSPKGNIPYEVYGIDYVPMLDATGFVQQGEASWYGEPFHGQLTSNGELYDMHELTAAHKTLPLPSYVRVTHLANNKSVILRVNDRGPFIGDRVIDLSYAAAKALGTHKKGVGEVFVEVLAPNDGSKKTVNEADYFIQTGAFSSMLNAEKLRDRIIAKGYDASVEKDQTLYKVKVGPYENPQSAYAEGKKISKLVEGNKYHITH